MFTCINDRDRSRLAVTVRVLNRRWFVVGTVLILSILLLGTMWHGVQAAPAAPPAVTVTSVNAPSAAPGEIVQYTIAVRVRTEAADSGTITFTMANQLAVVDASTHAFAIPSWSPGSNMVVWTVSPSFPVATVNFTVTAQVPATDNVLGDPLPYLAEARLCNVDGCGASSRSGSNTIVGPGILKQNTTSIIASDNGEHQAVAGETATIVVQFLIPEGTVAYSVTPRIVLQDGLVPISSVPAWTEVITGVRADLDTKTTLDGYQLEYPVSMEITESTTLEYTIQAVRMRNTDPAIKPSVEIVHNSPRLKIHPIMRWCDAPGCMISEESSAPHSAVNTTDDTTVSVVPVNPLVNTTIAHDFVSGIGGGGGQVRLIYTNVGAGTTSSPRPTAYDPIFTATLGVSLTVDTVSPMYDGMFQVGGTTVLTWAVPVDLASETTWAPVVTVTLPSPLVAGHSFTTTSRISYDTFAGVFDNEGVYVTDANHTFAVDVRNTKTSMPVANTQVTMGDVVTYQVKLEVGPNISLPVFHYTDTLPLGFQLLTPVSVTGAGGTLLGQQTAAGPSSAAGTRTALGWWLDELPPSPSGYVITSTYTVVNSGLDYVDEKVYVTTSNLAASMTDKNSVMMYWGDAGANGPAESAIRVIQPTLGNTTFNIVRTDINARDVNFPADYEITFRNSGRSPAYGVQICDTLPEGVMFLQNKNNPANLVSSPASGASGTICWQFSELANGVTSSIQYAVQVTDGAMPGQGLSNFAEVVGYSSKPGEVPYERNYADIETALSEKWCIDCLYVLGFEADKQVQQANTYPGEYITYTIAYSNSSAVYTYTNAFITDTYDANLIFVSANPPAEVHDPDARQLQWDLGTLTLATQGQIVLTLRVQDTITDGATSIVNTLLWDSDDSRPHQRQTITPLWIAEVGMELSGPTHTHADQTILYTVTYSNTGTASAPVTITLDYGPYVDFVSALPAPTQGDNVFADTVPNDGVEKTIQITLKVKAPLPYTLTQIDATAELETPGLLNLTEVLMVQLDRPAITLEKVAPTIAGLPNPPFDRMSYSIHLHNSGAYTATGVVLTDTWGLNTEYDDDNHNNYGWTAPAPGAGYVTRTLDLGIGESETFTFWVRVVGEAAFYTNTIEMTTDQTTLQSDVATAWSASIATSKSATPEPAFPGRVLTYTIYYTNTTPTAGALTGARITDTLPSAFTYQGQTVADGVSCPGGWTFTAPTGSGGEAVWSCDSLNNNASGRFLIWGLVAEAAEGTDLVNVTESSATGVAERPIDAPLVTRVARPWLRVDKAVVPTHPVAPGDVLTYTLTYENYGTDPAYNVLITDPLPAEVEYVSCSGGASCAEAAGVVTWNLATVPVDSVGTVQMVVQVKATAMGQMVNENYTIQSERLPVAETLNGAPVVSTIQAPALSLFKHASPPVVTAQNQPITYTIYYTNSGGGLLTQVVLTDVLSTLTFFSSASEACDKVGFGAGGTVTCDLGDLPQGTTGEVQIVVLNIATTEGQEITNSATGDADQITPVESNSTSVFYYGSGCVPPWNPSFTYSPTHPQAGAVVTFQGAVEAGDPPLTYTWTFGDDGVGAGQNVTHTYAVSATYTVVMTVDNPCGDPKVVTRYVRVTGTPYIAVAPVALDETVDDGYDAFTRTLTITNTGTGTLTWTAVVTPASETWLGLNPAGGTVAVGESAAVVVTFADGLAPDAYAADIRIRSDAVNTPTLDVPVTLTVNGVPRIAVSPVALDETVDDGYDAFTRTLTLTNTGTSDLTWTAIVTPASESWLSLTPVGGTVVPGEDAELVVTFAADLAPDVYEANIQISSDAANTPIIEVPVTLAVAGLPHIAVAPVALDETVDDGYDAFTRTLTLTNTGTSNLTWTAIVTPTSATWLTLTGASNGTVMPGGSTVLTVTFAAGQGPGGYEAGIRISSDADNTPTLDVPVTLTVNGVPRIAVSPVALDETVDDGYDAFTRTLTLTNTGTSALTWTAIVTPASESWLSLTPAGGTVVPGEDAELVVTFAADLAPDVYEANIQISSDAANTPVLEVPVTFTVTEQSGAPEIAWTPSSGFTKSADEDSSTILTDTLTVSNQGDANLYWSLVVTPTATTWLSVSVTAGTPGTSIVPQVTAPDASTPVTVYFDPTGLTAGTYNAQLRIESNDADEGVVLVPVTFTIRAPDEDYYIYLPLVLRNH